MALHSGSFQHRSWDSGFYFLFQFCVRFSVIVRFLQNASFEIGSSPLPPPPLSDGPLVDSTMIFRLLPLKFYYTLSIVGIEVRTVLVRVD